MKVSRSTRFDSSAGVSKIVGTGETSGFGAAAAKLAGRTLAWARGAVPQLFTSDTMLSVAVHRALDRVGWPIPGERSRTGGTLSGA